MNKILITLGAAAMLAATTVQAGDISADIQKTAYDVATSTNWVMAGFFGQSFSGQKRVAGAAVAWNFSENVGLLFGGDTLWTFGNGPKQTANNIIKGGVTLSLPVPLTFIGLTNSFVTPFVAELMSSTTKSSDSSIGEITTIGINVVVASFKGFDINTGYQYEKRTDQGFWNGDYGLIHLGVSRGIGNGHGLFGIFGKQNKYKTYASIY